MPGCSSTRVPGRILWLQHQCGPVRSDDLHGMETQSSGESHEAQVCNVPPGEREGIHHREGFQNQEGFASLGKDWLAACRRHSLQLVSPVTSATSVRLNLSCISATLHHCDTLLHAYYSLVGAWCLFRSPRLPKVNIYALKKAGRLLLHGNTQINMCMTVLFVLSMFLLSLTSPMFRHS